MTPEQFAAWKHERGFDQVPTPDELAAANGKTPLRCLCCNQLEPCECTRLNHSHDEAGSFVTPQGVLMQLNEAGWNSTQIDLRELIAWLRAHRPDLLV